MRRCAPLSSKIGRGLFFSPHLSPYQQKLPSCLILVHFNDPKLGLRGDTAQDKDTKVDQSIVGPLSSTGTSDKSFYFSECELSELVKVGIIREVAAVLLFVTAVRIQ